MDPNVVKHSRACYKRSMDLALMELIRLLKEFSHPWPDTVVHMTTIRRAEVREACATFVAAFDADDQLAHDFQRSQSETA